MDPNLFHLDYERAFELIVTLSVIAIFVERALAPIFESRWFIEKTDGKSVVTNTATVEKTATVQQESTLNSEAVKVETTSTAAANVTTKGKKKGVREIIALVVSFGVCWYWDVDAMSILLQTKETVTVAGMVVTAGIISGGAKGSSVLFKDFLKIMSSAEKERKERNELLQTATR